MKIKKFNESVDLEKYLIKKYNEHDVEYKVKFITTDDNDLFAGGGGDSLEKAVDQMLSRKKVNNNGYFYILKETITTEVVPNEEIERMIDAKKYNL